MHLVKVEPAARARLVPAGGLEAGVLVVVEKSRAGFAHALGVRGGVLAPAADRDERRGVGGVDRGGVAVEEREQVLHRGAVACPAGARAAQHGARVKAGLVGVDSGGVDRALGLVHDFPGRQRRLVPQRRDERRQRVVEKGLQLGPRRDQVLHVGLAHERAVPQHERDEDVERFGVAQEHAQIPRHGAGAVRGRDHSRASVEDGHSLALDEEPDAERVAPRVRDVPEVLLKRALLGVRRVVAEVGALRAEEGEGWRWGWG